MTVERPQQLPTSTTAEPPESEDRARLQVAMSKSASSSSSHPWIFLILFRMGTNKTQPGLSLGRAWRILRSMKSDNGPALPVCACAAHRRIFGRRDEPRKCLPGQEPRQSAQGYSTFDISRSRSCKG